MRGPLCRASALAASAVLGTVLSGFYSGAWAADPAPGPGRIEARSTDFLAVGVVQDARMAIHLSRISDNAPIHDAALTVVLRGTPHAAVAQTDGSYAIETPDLKLAGPAAVQFQVTEGTVRQDLSGTLQSAGQAAQTDSKGSSRQLGWWVLNFAVCIGFLMLWSRRKKRVEEEEEKSAP